MLAQFIHLSGLRKSVWEPTQVLDWLGITWNSALGTLKIVERRILKVINTIDHIIEADFKVSARELASFTGQIISTGPIQLVTLAG